MRILAICDQESKSLWDFFEKEKLDRIDLILSCGDLSPNYLSFLATLSHAPVLYVPGNHDGCYDRTPPGGCICIDDDIYTYKGVRILGLGGSMRYCPGRPQQYTQHEMCKRVKKLRFKLFKNKGFDILLTHSPAFHLNDDEDLPHQGFQVFHTLMDKYEPKYFIHGHVHANYGGNYKRRCTHNNTEIINAFEKYAFDFETGEDFFI